MTLGEYLLCQRGTAWRPGVFDCSTFAGDWVCNWGCGDPMAEWRGHYSTDEEADALVTKAGGLLPLWDRGLAGIAAVTTKPVEGDVGVIHAVAQDHSATMIGAIWTGRRWAFRIPAGIAVASAEPARIWGRKHG